MTSGSDHYLTARALGLLVGAAEALVIVAEVMRTCNRPGN
jgi:hypothetical protein